MTTKQQVEHLNDRLMDLTDEAHRRLAPLEAERKRLRVQLQALTHRPIEAWVITLDA